MQDQFKCNEAYGCEMLKYTNVSHIVSIKCTSVPLDTGHVYLLACLATLIATSFSSGTGIRRYKHACRFQMKKLSSGVEKRVCAWTFRIRLILLQLTLHQNPKSDTITSQIPTHLYPLRSAQILSSFLGPLALALANIMHAVPASEKKIRYCTQ